jgi:hypothetical protein
MNCEKMILYITHLKDILQNNYLGIKIPVTMIQSYLNELKEILGEDDYVKYNENQNRILKL